MNLEKNLAFFVVIQGVSNLQTKISTLHSDLAEYLDWTKMAGLTLQVSDPA